VQPGDHDKEFVDEAVGGSIAADAAAADVPPGDSDKGFVDEGALSPVIPDAASADAPLSPRDEAQPTSARDSVQPQESSTDTIANAGTIGEIDPNAFHPSSAKPKRKLRKPRRRAAAGADRAALAATAANAETGAEADASTVTAVETDANTQPVFEHFDQMPVEKQSQSEPVNRGARDLNDDRALR